MSNPFATPWTIALQAPLSMRFSRQKYWSGLLFPSPGDIPDPGIEPVSPALTDKFFTTESLGKPIDVLSYWLKIHVYIWYSWAKYPNKIVYRSLLITFFDHLGDFGKYEILVNYSIIVTTQDPYFLEPLVFTCPVRLFPDSKYVM